MRRPDMALGAVLLAAILPAASGSAWAQTCTCATGSGGAPGVTIMSDDPPPPLPEYDQPPIPSAGYLWAPGYWAWNNEDYYWVPGTWVEPPQPGLLWTPGYWAFANGVYGYHRGYWGSHVGYYGGVDYGYGYGGAGYAGGYWNGDRLYYNSTVNNFGSVRVENVYEKAAPNNPNNGRMSFNGPGGVVARPTAQDEEFAREKRIPPTKGQIDHAHTASVTTGLFESNNHGKPSIAATAKPAAFTGPGVVPAKEGGAPVHRVNEPSNGEPNKATPSPEPSGANAPQKGVTPSPEPSRTPETHGKAAPDEPQKRVEPTPEPHKTPAAGATTEPRIPPKVEEQRREPQHANEPQKRVVPTPEPQRAPPAAKLPPAAEPQHEERRPPVEPPKPVAPAAPAKVERPNPPAAAAPGAKPPAGPHPQGAEHKCGEPGEPKCP